MFALKYANNVKFLHLKGKQEDKDIENGSSEKKSDTLIYVLTSCLTVSLHQVIDTYLRFFHLIIFIRLSISDLV